MKRIELERLYNIGDFANLRFKVMGGVDIPDELPENIVTLMVMKEYLQLDKHALLYLKNSVFTRHKFKDSILKGELEDAFAEVDKQVKKNTLGLKQAFAELQVDKTTEEKED